MLVLVVWPEALANEQHTSWCVCMTPVGVYHVVNATPLLSFSEWGLGTRLEVVMAIINSGHKDFQSNPALVQRPFVFSPGHQL